LEKSECPYSRILLKISGQIFSGARGGGLSRDAIQYIATEIFDAIKESGVQMGIVIGGGNIVRGTESEEMGIERVTADYMGMLATVINSLALQNVLEQMGLTTRLMTALSMSQVAEPYVRRRAIRHLEKGRVVLFACGTGNPFFSTDTAAVLRASEIEAEVVLKATRVEGVYTADPAKDPKAKKLDVVDYDKMLKDKLGIVDATAAALCRENNLPLIVFNFMKRGNLLRILRGEPIGTLVKG
jgi:uridylate kinase